MAKNKPDLLFFERNLYRNGIKYIAGVDEAGRGPLAGPLVASAVILDLERVINLLDDIFTNNDVIKNKYSDKHSEDKFYTRINDSKTLSPRIRGNINDKLIKECIDYSIVEISVEEIDSMGISQANNTAFKKTIEKLSIKPGHILTDHFEIKQISHESQTNITRGDSLSITIASASILAKVYRDTIMTNMHKIYPQYNFAQHKGYGTREHIDNLKEFGPCEIHRKSFEPAKSMFFANV